MTLPSWSRKNSILFLNPKTCGIYKNGGSRYKINSSGQRTNEVDNELLEQVESLLSQNLPNEVDNELLEQVESLLSQNLPDGAVRVPNSQCQQTKILVPNYYDPRWDEEFNSFLNDEELDSITLGELKDQGVVKIGGGHGSPGNDQRIGEIPYVKVSDIRSMRININPTNMVPRPLAEKLWGKTTSDLQAWDVITPNRASNNIGEFAMLLPGEEDVVLTKEMFVIRTSPDSAELGWSPFYLMWAFCLKAVRRQWRRVVLMQTNREDVGSRYREIRLPVPKSKEYAQEVSSTFQDFFMSIAESRQKFLSSIESSPFSYIPNIMKVTSIVEDADGEEVEPEDTP